MITEELLSKVGKALKVPDSGIVSQVTSLMEAIKEIENFGFIGGYTGFFPGSIVLDSKDNELGFIVGPLDVFGRNSKCGDNKTYLIVTIPNIDDGSKSRYRVRYVQKKYLTPFNVIGKGEDKKSGLDDINTFCSLQCIMNGDCSEECVLRKYRKEK